MHVSFPFAVHGIRNGFVEGGADYVAARHALTGGSPLDPSTMIGAQVSNDQYEKILSYIDIGKQEGAEVLTGGGARDVAGHPGGYYVEPTIFRGTNSMRIFQEEIFGPTSMWHWNWAAMARGSSVPIGRTSASRRSGSRRSRCTRQASRASRCSGSMRTPIVGDVPSFRADQMPYGGMKDSGVGREGPAAAMADFTEERVTVLTGLTL